MKVIKVVTEMNNRLDSTLTPRLVSAHTEGVWEKEYKEGVETISKVGYLFAYSSRNLKRAKKDFRFSYQFWLANAKVVGRMNDQDISNRYDEWRTFWKHFRLKPRGEYLLCSSITLIKRIA